MLRRVANATAKTTVWTRTGTAPVSPDIHQPFGPGGSADVLARLLAKPVADHLGQQLLIENKPQYLPQWWDVVNDNDFYGNWRDPRHRCMPEGLPRIGAPSLGGVGHPGGWWGAAGFREDLVVRDAASETYTNRTAAPINVLSGPNNATTPVAPGQTVTVPGRIQYILDSVVNLAFQKVEGYDFEVNYRKRTTDKDGAPIEASMVLAVCVAALRCSGRSNGTARRFTPRTTQQFHAAILARAARRPLRSRHA